MHIGNNEKVMIVTDNSGEGLPARLLAVDEVAHFLGVHTSTIRRWEKGGLLKSYSIGLRRNLRFRQDDVLNFINNKWHRYRNTGLNQRG
jgi:excisionase family DNA binding protein